VPDDVTRRQAAALAAHRTVAAVELPPEIAESTTGRQAAALLASGRGVLSDPGHGPSGAPRDDRG
jgi:hypothetical protein